MALKHPWEPAGSRRQPALLGAGICLLVCCLLTGCGVPGGNADYSPTGMVTGRNSTGTAASTPHSDSDPGNRKLHLLAADPVLADLPAGLIRTSEKQTPAHYETPVFGSGGSFGAGVSVTFTSAASLSDVYRIIGENAAQHGWVALATGSTSLANRWLKIYPDGSPATLLLTCTNPNAPTPTHSCFLDSGI